MKKTTFVPKTPSTLTGFAKTLSTGEQSVVAQICDTIMHDLENICKATGTFINDERFPNTTECWLAEGEFKGKYVGFGLGRGWLELGFLENAVADMLRERLKKGLTASVKETPGHVDTMTGTVSHSGDFYMTSKGAYRLSHTYCWFVHKRV